MRVAVIGATGQAGRVVCRLLQDETGIDVVACGRNDSRLTALKASLPGGGESVGTATFNLSDHTKLDSVLESADVVVGATSSWRDGPQIAERAARHGTSYLGIYMSTPEKWKQLRALHDLCLKHDVAVVDDGGVHPGMPGAMIRFLNEESPLATAWVGGKFAVKWSALELAPETILDFVSELRSMNPTLRVDGDWKRGYRHGRRFDFAEGRGPTPCVPMCLEEIREVVKDLPELRSTGFFIAGFGPIVDYVVMPLALALGRLSPSTAARLVWMGLRRFASSEESVVLVLEATNQDGRDIQLRVSHHDAYAMTAIPAVAAVKQMFSAERPGVWTQAAFVKPLPFLKDTQQMGISVELDGHAL